MFADYIATLSAAISFVAMGFSIYYAKSAKRQNSGSMELEVRNQIRACQARVEDLTIQNFQILNTEPKSEIEKKQRDLLAETVASAIEASVNAYDEACSKYLDNKIDRVRFKKMYQTEIRQLVENHQGKFGTATKYVSLRAVFEEWEQNPRI